MKREVTTNTEFYSTFPFPKTLMCIKYIITSEIHWFFKLYTKVEPEKNENVEVDRRAFFFSSLCSALSICVPRKY